MCETKKNARNGLPALSSGSWVCKTPENKKTAVFFKENGLGIRLQPDSYGMGKWVARAAVQPQKTYALEAQCETEADICDVYAIFTLFQKDGAMTIREHFETTERDGNTIRYGAVFKAPDNVVEMEVELWLKGRDQAVLWQKAVCAECEEIPERMVKIALGYIEPEYDHAHTYDENRQKILDSIDACGSRDADLIVLSETSYSLGVSKQSAYEDFETEEGSMCAAIREKARQFGAYIVYNFHERDGEDYYNTSILIDRNGNTAGKFRKTHLTVTEFDMGLTPGEEFPVFSTDFGKIGMLICFDQFFPRTAERLADNGAEIICVSTIGDACEKSSARAMDNGVYFAVCGTQCVNACGHQAARVIAPDGKILAQTGKSRMPAVCSINLNEKKRMEWLSLGPAHSEIRGVYRFERNPHI